MTKKIKIIIWGLVCLILIAAAFNLLLGNPVILINNQKLKHSICSLDNRKSVSLNDVIPFEWDTLYTFEPYESKTEIEKIIGFQSADIKENNINEGMVHLLFVKNNKVVASILGYSNNLGYNIDFASKEGLKVTHSENAGFNIAKADGITTLWYSDRKGYSPLEN